MPKPYDTSWAAVYLNPKDKCFSVVAEAKKGLGRVEVGDPVSLTDGEFDERIASILISFLDSFHTNIYSPEIARGGTQEENHRFVRNNLAVSVERIKSGELLIRPKHHEKGGYVARTGEQILVAAKDIPGRIPHALREAFALAT